MSEEWRDVVGWEGVYKVSDRGRVKSLDRRIKHGTTSVELKGRIKKLSIHAGGYHRVSFSRNNKKLCFLVSRLVALAFIPNPDGLPQVDHINEKTNDNRVSNLQWITQHENIERSQSKTFYFISPKGKRVKVFNLNKFCRDNRLHSGNMSAVHDGRRNQAEGWVAA